MKIDADKSLLVVGSPRSGTSLCMRALGALGIPLKYVDIPEEKRSERMHTLNPNGYYEGPWTGHGLSTSRADCAGHAIKVMSNAAMPNRTDYTLISGVILCVRNPRDQMKSISEMHYPVRRMPGMWLQTFGRYASWLLSSDVPYVVIDFEDWYENKGDLKIRSDTNAVKLINFVGSESPVSVVSDLFDSELVRNSSASNWVGAEVVHGGCCDEFYQALSIKEGIRVHSTPDEKDAAAATINVLRAAFEQKAEDDLLKKKTRWVDVDSDLVQNTDHTSLFHGTWNCTNAEDNVVLNSKPVSRKRIKLKHEKGVKYAQKHCKHFGVSTCTEEKAVFNGDFPLTVLIPKVACTYCSKDVSMLDCYRCWHGGTRMGHAPKINQLFGEVAL